MEEKQYRNYTGAVILIAIGIVFLLNTTGIIGWEIWQYIFRFWPVIFVLMGIKLILGKSLVSRIIASVIYLITFILIGLCSYSYMRGQTIPFVPQNITNCIFNYCENINTTIYKEEDSYITATEYPNVTEKTLKLSIAATNLTITDNDITDYYHITSHYYSSEYKPALESTLNNGVLTTTFDNTNIQTHERWEYNAPEYTIDLGQNNVPTNIDIKLGAGKADINLSETALKLLTASVGAGNLNITLADNAIPENMNIEIGAGNVTLNLPSDVGTQITYKLGVGSIKLADGISISQIGEDQTRKSDNYDTATRKINIIANIGVGKLTFSEN